MMPHRSESASIVDLRFRALLNSEDWFGLPAPIRARFSKRIADGGPAVYVGTIIETRFSAVGWMLAQAARLIGGPLPVEAAHGVPAIVSVTEDAGQGGQIWTRIYPRRGGFPQVIHSAKRFAGPTGLEEHVGCGIGMALAVRADERSIAFRSAHYFLRIAGYRWRLPRWMEPGAITVTHTELGGGRFRFTLRMEHERVGELIYQEALFSDT